MSIYLRSLTPLSFFFFNDPATTEIYTLSLHDALPIYQDIAQCRQRLMDILELARQSNVGADQRGNGQAKQNNRLARRTQGRSEEHTSELQSPCNLVCRLLLEKKKTNILRT